MDVHITHSIEFLISQTGNTNIRWFFWFTQ